MAKFFSRLRSRSHRAVWLFCGIACLAFPLRSLAQSPRSETALNENWRFRFSEDVELEKIQTTSLTWDQVNLPHTWNAVDGADGGNNYARGTGWYVRRFAPDRSWQARRVFIEFKGASRNATVFLNGKRIGDHQGAFARFRFDLTDALRWDGENTLIVRVNNAQDGLPPYSADFTFFGGLYRGVRLFAVASLHVEVMDHGADGVYFKQTAVTPEKAEFAVTTKLRNDSLRPAEVVVRTSVQDDKGAVVASKEDTVALGAHTTGQCVQPLAIASPRLWNGRSDPYLYTTHTALVVNGVVMDAVEQAIGVRTFSVDPDWGFFLNGRPLDLRGASRHQDRAGKGWAISADDDREDFALMMEIGSTAVRVAHYPQSELWFDLADEKGLVSWAEIPLVNEVLPTTAFADNARQQLLELIRQNYNRPSICFWGVGNETREADERGGRHRPDGPVANRILAELAAVARNEDDTRLSVYASHHRPEDIKNHHTDVLAFNKYIGWYGGNAPDFGQWADEAHRKFPAARIGVSEYGAGANPAQHDSSLEKPVPTGKWHPEEYQAYFHEEHWRAMSTRDYLWSKFIWNMFDFAVDERDEGGTPGMNDKGLVTYDRKLKKDAFYFYKAVWSLEPVLHIAGRRHTERPDARTEIKVYSNARQVELFVSDKSCGVVTSDDGIFRWQVELAGGPNRVVARASSGTTELTDECQLSYVPKAQN